MISFPIFIFELINKEEWNASSKNIYLQEHIIEAVNKVFYEFCAWCTESICAEANGSGSKVTKSANEVQHNVEIFICIYTYVNPNRPEEKFDCLVSLN